MICNSVWVSDAARTRRKQVLRAMHTSDVSVVVQCNAGAWLRATETASRLEQIVINHHCLLPKCILYITGLRMRRSRNLRAYSSHFQLGTFLNILCYYGRPLCNRERPLYFASFFYFFPNTLSPPSLHRFSPNFATRRRFVGNTLCLEKRDLCVSVHKSGKY